jgi:hypothetical protein
MIINFVTLSTYKDPINMDFQIVSDYPLTGDNTQLFKN